MLASLLCILMWLSGAIVYTDRHGSRLEYACVFKPVESYTEGQHRQTGADHCCVNGEHCIKRSSLCCVEKELIRFVS